MRTEQEWSLDTDQPLIRVHLIRPNPKLDQRKRLLFELILSRIRPTGTAPRLDLPISNIVRYNPHFLPQIQNPIVLLLLTEQNWFQRAGIERQLIQAWKNLLPQSGELSWTRIDPQYFRIKLPDFIEQNIDLLKIIKPFLPGLYYHRIVIFSYLKKI
jgi:hypothetical protein